jgi:murein DD-endopeptidase MepM/ murein hydrolase activator NlpD
MTNLRSIAIPKKSKRSFKVPALVILLLALGGGGLYIYFMRDTAPPLIVWKNPVEVMGKKGELEIEISDRDQGIAQASVALQSSEGETVTLYQETFAPPLKEKTLTLHLDTKKLREGEVKLLVQALDKPSIELLSANQGTFSASFSIDLTPPRLMPVTGSVYLQRGGSQMIVFRTSEDTTSAGVRFGDRDYPGFTGIFPDRPRTGVVLFPFPAKEKPSGYPILFARDQVGNEAVIDLNVRLKKRAFRIRDINISNGFLDRKMPVLAQTNEIPGETNLDIYIYANRTTREQNAERIMQICQNSTPDLLWEGKFHQLSNSKAESFFADHRSYYYKGEKIDEQDHLGVDLAVTRHYPVEAAARGIVIFEGYLGIYGNTIILDHGLGVFTLYGHLSMIEVKVGQSVEKKESMGKTGKTGLAGGDHLHFAVLLHGIPVNPLEWWDRNWMQNTIFSKLLGLLPQESNDISPEGEEVTSP